MSIPMAGDSIFDLATQPQHVGHGSRRCAETPCKAVIERADRRSADRRCIVLHSVSFSEIFRLVRISLIGVTIMEYLKSHNALRPQHDMDPHLAKLPSLLCGKVHAILRLHAYQTTLSLKDPGG